MMNKKTVRFLVITSYVSLSLALLLLMIGVGTKNILQHLDEKTESHELSCGETFKNNKWVFLIIILLLLSNSTILAVLYTAKTTRTVHLYSNTIIIFILFLSLFMIRTFTNYMLISLLLIVMFGLNVTIYQQNKRLFE